MWDKDEKMIELINTHYNLELCSHNMYIELASRLHLMGHLYASEFLKKLAKDKIGPHMDRIYGYFTSLDLQITVNQHSLPKEAIDSYDISEIFKAVLDNEILLRKHVKYLVNFALSVKDYESFEFLQWFVKDAIKDINDVKDIIGYIEAGGDNKLSIEAMIRKWLKDNNDN